MKKKNTFINVTASMGRGLLYAYLYIMFRPKICYQSRKAKEEIEKGGVIFIGNHVDTMMARCFICFLETVSS